MERHTLTRCDDAALEGSRSHQARFLIINCLPDPVLYCNMALIATGGRPCPSPYPVLFMYPV